VIVRTFEGLQALTAQQPTWGSHGSSLRLYDQHQSYAEIYRRDPNMRIPIDFLMRNVAHLSPPQVFRRVSDTDRVRLTNHPLARWLKYPNPATTGYRLFETLMGDLGVYMEAFWLKVRYDDAAGAQIGLLALPPQEMAIQGGVLPAEFRWTSNGQERAFPPSEIVYFNGYNPIDRLRGLSLFETLRSIAAEDAAASEHRESFWRNASRQEGVIEQATDAPAGKWSPDQKNAWRDQWQARHTGSAAGQVALLEPGWSFKAGSFSPKDAEYIAGMKARREVSAAGWHAPQPFVGILDHATFSNIREQHKNLYQDVLGPTFEMIIQELERQVLPECDDQDRIYLEYNVAAKLAGTPEERATSMQVSIGRPWRTVNEGRALDNLPRLDDPELDTVAPQQGGPSDATAHPEKATAPMMTKPGDATDSAAETIIRQFWARQSDRILKMPADERALFFDAARWDAELSHDLGGQDAWAHAINLETVALLEAGAPAFARNRPVKEPLHG
jgi:HK97 family phage portal protein